MSRAEDQRIAALEKIVEALKVTRADLRTSLAAERRKNTKFMNLAEHDFVAPEEVDTRCATCNHDPKDEDDYIGETRFCQKDGCLLPSWHLIHRLVK